MNMLKINLDLKGEIKTLRLRERPSEETTDRCRKTQKGKI